MMSPEWQGFLHDAGAVIQDGRVMHFGNPAHEIQVVTSGEVIADLSHRALIAVRGADAEKFLQGQLTNDVLAVDDRHSQLSAHCSPKGRVLSLFRLFRHDGTLYLALPGTLLESALAGLRKYVLMSKVTFGVETELAQMGYTSAKGTQHLKGVLGPLPETVDDVTHCGEITIIRIPGSPPRFELIGPVEALTRLWARLDVHAAPVGTGPWELLDIRAGVPLLQPATVGAFIPQMLNLDVLGGINFKKGCYTGQEIVARSHYLGKLKRRMFLLHCPAPPPAAATPLFNTALRSDEGVGAVVAAQASADGETALLAVLQIEATDRGELRLGGREGPICTLQALPYALEIPTGG